MSAAKRLVPIAGGILSGITIVVTTDSVIGALYPAPPEIDMTDGTQLTSFVEKMPDTAFALMLAGYVAASLAAGIVATALAKRYSRGLITPMRPAVICGVVLTAANIANAFQLPHPMWLIAANVIFHLPAALLGYFIAKNRPIEDKY
jgi:hypothetical protein